MKICLLSTSLLKTPPLFGGAIEIFTYELGRGLAKLNNRVIIITINGRIEISKVEPNLKIVPLKIPFNSFFRGIIYNFKIVKYLLKQELIDILHTQGTAVFPSAYFVSKRRGIPIIHTEHVYSPWILTSFKKLVKIIKYPFERFLGQFTLNNAEKIVVATEFMQKSLQAANPKIKSKIEIIPQGINQEMFNPKVNQTYVRKKYNLSETDKLILYVGRITPEKNIEILIKAFSMLRKKYDNINLFLVGPKFSQFPTKSVKKFSKYYLKLKDWIQKNNLTDAIVFTGSIPYEKIPYYYAACDLFVQPSLLETFGRATFEAAAVGCPFINSLIGKKKPFYLPKESGIFIEETNSLKLQSAVQTILDNEAKFKESGKLSASLMQIQYNWIEIAKKYLKIYRDLIKN